MAKTDWGWALHQEGTWQVRHLRRVGLTVRHVTIRNYKDWVVKIARNAPRILNGECKVKADLQVDRLRHAPVPGGGACVLLLLLRLSQWLLHISICRVALMQFFVLTRVAGMCPLIAACKFMTLNMGGSVCKRLTILERNLEYARSVLRDIPVTSA